VVRAAVAIFLSPGIENTHTHWYESIADLDDSLEGRAQISKTQALPAVTQETARNRQGGLCWAGLSETIVRLKGAAFLLALPGCSLIRISVRQLPLELVAGFEECASTLARA
jgi:hypothetical protein